MIDALGGNANAAELLEVGYNSITNWKMADRFPGDTYTMIQHELRMRSRTAPDYLWRMRVAKKKARGGK